MRTAILTMVAITLVGIPAWVFRDWLGALPAEDESTQVLLDAGSNDRESQDDV